VKILVQPVALERDADGKIVGEKTGEAVALYDLDAVAEYVEQLRQAIEQQNAASLNGKP